MPAGTNVASGSLISPGGQQGIPGPNAVSTDAGNQATFGSDAKIYVPNPTPTITSVRLRSFNAVGNPNFQVDQRMCNNWFANPASGSFIMDRWAVLKQLTGGFQACSDPGIVLLPGTNFSISNAVLRVYVLATQASLAVGDILTFQQQVEGPQWRELSNDVHSISLLVKSDVANLKFSVALRAPTGSRSLVKLCTIPAANTWTLIQLPNIPVWASGGSWSATPGIVGYVLNITLACGPTETAPAADTWQNGNFYAAPGMSNWMSNAVGTNFYCAVVQHEPGPVCSTLIDKPFTGANGNYEECLRYYCKSYDYTVLPGSTSVGISCYFSNPLISTTTYLLGTHSFPKPMATRPTMVIYNPTTGAQNSVRQAFSTTDCSVSGTGCGERGINNITLSSTLAAQSYGEFHYTADTGW